MVFAPGFSLRRSGGRSDFVPGPEGALILRVVADGVAVAVGEVGGAGGEEQEQDCVHNLAIGCFKQNISMTGLGKFRQGGDGHPIGRKCLKQNSRGGGGMRGGWGRR